MEKFDWLLLIKTEVTQKECLTPRGDRTGGKKTLATWAGCLPLEQKEKKKGRKEGKKNIGMVGLKKGTFP